MTNIFMSDQIILAVEKTAFLKSICIVLHTEIHIYCVTFLKSMFIVSPINNLMDIVSRELKKSAKRPKIGFHEDALIQGPFLFWANLSPF